MRAMGRRGLDDHARAWRCRGTVKHPRLSSLERVTETPLAPGYRVLSMFVLMNHAETYGNAEERQDSVISLDLSR